MTENLEFVVGNKFSTRLSTSDILESIGLLSSYFKKRSEITFL